MLESQSRVCFSSVESSMVSAQTSVLITARLTPVNPEWAWCAVLVGELLQGWAAYGGFAVQKGHLSEMQVLDSVTVQVWLGTLCGQLQGAYSR